MYSFKNTIKKKIVVLPVFIYGHEYASVQRESYSIVKLSLFYIYINTFYLNVINLS